MNTDELKRRVEQWMADDPDPSTRAELAALLAQGDPAKTDLADRFAGDLAFGTAGLRGVLGAGPNRMNRAVVARATWALARELSATVPEAARRGVIVGGDARRLSRELSEEVAAILATAGLTVVFFAGPVPTPLVGFAVRQLGAAGGVVITASHNPPEYNGYKVYWSNGVQIVPPIDAHIASAIERAPPARSVPHRPIDDLRRERLVADAPASIEESYLKGIRALAVHPHDGDRSIGVVYTPLHGCGDRFVHAALADAGFTHVTSVPEQARPDGAFPTVSFPNPEERGAMDLAFALAAKTAARLVLANDPDVDRLSVGIPDGGGFRQLTGNEVGALLGHYLLTEKPAGPRRAVLTSIVSSPLLGRIAAALGVHYEETLTGFKWLSSRTAALQEEGFEVVFAFEEALGYCVGDLVRDKDGISAAALAAEVAAVLAARGKSVEDELEAIALRYGLFVSGQHNEVRKGAEGAAAIQAIMAKLRLSVAAGGGEIAGDPVIAVTDYQARERTDLSTRDVTGLSLPQSDVLAFELASGSRIVARPSGTEPKAKFYFDVREEVVAGEPPREARGRALARLDRLRSSFLERAC
jgi:phosphomannomutase